MKELVINIFKSPEFQSKMKTFLWQTVGGFLTLFGFFLEVLKPEVVDPKMLLAISASISGVTMLTKYINKKYL